MTTPTHSPDEWQPCAPGQISDVVRRLKTAHRRRVLRQVVVPVAVVLVAAVVAGSYMASHIGPRGSLACNDVRSYLAQYQAGNLSADLMGRIEAHLSQCPDCSDHAEKHHGQVDAPAVDAVAGHDVPPRTIAWTDVRRHSHAR